MVHSLCMRGREGRRRGEGKKGRGESTHLNSFVGSPLIRQSHQCLLHDWCLFANTVSRN